MIESTLLVKAHSEHQCKQIEKALNEPFSELNVKARVISTIAGGWVQAAFEGEDENIAANYAVNEFGVCPTSINKVREAAVLKGYIIDFGKDNERITVDVGIFQPKIVHTVIPLLTLQTQLVAGRKISIRKIAELYGLCEDLPVEVEVTRFAGDESEIAAQFSDGEVNRFQAWQESLLDRLVILGLTSQDVKSILKHEKLDRDIIDIESLGLLEHALTCKLGTDAAGLIPKIGKEVRRARFAVFNPKRILSFRSLPIQTS